MLEWEVILKYDHESSEFWPETKTIVEESTFFLPSTFPVNHHQCLMDKRYCGSDSQSLRIVYRQRRIWMHVYDHMRDNRIKRRMTTTTTTNCKLLEQLCIEVTGQHLTMLNCCAKLTWIELNSWFIHLTHSLTYSLSHFPLFFHNLIWFVSDFVIQIQVFVFFLSITIVRAKC